MVPSARSRFIERFVELTPFEADRVLAETLGDDASTVVAALHEAGVEGDHRPAIDGPELSEALTLARLLGRRAALVDASTSAALGLAPAVLHALEVVDAGLLEALRVSSVDGFVRGREELETVRSARRAADAIAVAEFGPGTWAVFLRSEQEAEELERVIEELGRTLLARDASTCIVDAEGLRAPDRDRAAQLFTIHETCVMLGVRCVFVGVADSWKDAATDRGTNLSDVHFVRSLADALAACDIEVRSRTPLGKALRRLVGR